MIKPQTKVTFDIFKKTNYFFRRNPYFYYLFTFFVFLLIYLYFFSITAASGNVSFYIFQTRDIFRAVELLKGNMIFYGPELTGGGNLPGPFYYFLIAIPLYFKKNWLSVWYFYYALSFIALYLASIFVIQRKSFVSSLLIFFALITSYLFLHLNSYFTNATFAFPFSVLVLTSLSTNHKYRLYFASFLLGLTVQLHFSTLFIALCVLYIIYNDKNLNMRQKKLTTFKCIFFLILPILPYLTWLMIPSFFNNSQLLFIPSQTSNSIPSIAHILKENLFNYFENSNLSNKEILEFLYGFLQIFPMPAFLFFISIVCLKPKGNLLKNKLIPLLYFSIPAFLIWLFYLQIRRYLIPFSLSLIFFYGAYFNLILRKKSLLKLMYIGLLTFSTIQLLLLIFFPSKFRDHLFLIWVGLFIVSLILYFSKIKKLNKIGFILINFVLLYFPIQLFSYGPDQISIKSKEASILYRDFLNQTGLPLSKFKQSTYLVNFHSSSDLFLFDETFDATNEFLSDQTLPFDGLIILNLSREARLNQSSINKVFSFLNRSNVHPVLLDYIYNNKIILQPLISSSRTIIPFKYKDNMPNKLNFQNIGLSYQTNLELLDFISSPEGLSADKKTLYIKWNDCVGYKSFCTFGFKIILSSINNKINLLVNILGFPLSQRSNWVTQSWTQSLSSPFIEYSCKNSSIKHKFEIISSVGYSRQFSASKTTEFFGGNNSVLAPLKFNQLSNCEKINSISAGFKNSLIDDIYSVKTFQGKSKTIILN